MVPKFVESNSTAYHGSNLWSLDSSQDSCHIRRGLDGSNQGAVGTLNCPCHHIYPVVMECDTWSVLKHEIKQEIK